MDYYSDIGRMIKEIRVRKKISRKELCDGVCSISFLSRVENGSRTPNIVILKQWSMKLGVSSEMLFRMIESRGSGMVFEYASNVQTDLELHRYAKIHDETLDFLSLELNSVHDRQTILALHHISEYCITLDVDRALDKLQKTLDLTYKPDTLLSFTEVALLTEIALVHLRLGNLDHATAIKQSIEENTLDHTHKGKAVTKIKFDIVSIIIDYKNKELALALQKTEDLLGYIKDKAYHGFLIETFYLQSLILAELGKKVLAEKALTKMVTLKELISTDSDSDYIFITDIALNRK